MFASFFKSETTQQLPDFASLVPENPIASPVWSGELERHYSMKTRRAIPDAIAERIWASRSLLSAAEFAKYWSDAREAENAWLILHLAKENFGRPDLPMAYPNDPMGLYSIWCGDSLDIEEFIMGLEEIFCISISDADAEKILLDFTLMETVQYLLEKRNPAK